MNGTKVSGSHLGIAMQGGRALPSFLVIKVSISTHHIPDCRMVSALLTKHFRIHGKKDRKLNEYV